MKKLVLLSLACAGVMITGCVWNTRTKMMPMQAPVGWWYPRTGDFQNHMQYANLCRISLTDWHIHIRGGMTPYKAAERESLSGIRSTVLENFGREWPLSNNVELARFIIDGKKPFSVAVPIIISDGKRLGGHIPDPLPVGIQVNDRDWYRQIDPRLYEQLDFVLADTMIMGVTAEGKPQRLWLPDVKIDDADAWMEEYMAHNLRILDEPVSILANPTYLPPCISNQYERLWTEDRMRQVIAKAVANGVALEIQAESPYPKPAFITLAKQMGAKFCFGTNNSDDKVKDLSTWFNAIKQLDLRPSDIAEIKRRPL
ncbi:MAG: hypothetical protein FWH21_09750 [Kiritimatiellaeota bacterium]|nr:hypothetical protein [Kiritimatiellota bacterium]